jgi:hypothetical protein
VANYPSIPQLIGTIKDTQEGTVVDRAVSGKPRFRTFYSQPWTTFRVLHEVDTTDKSTLEAHYLAHRRSTFSFTYAGDSSLYTCRYAEYPQIVAIEGDARWKIQTVLVVVDRLPYGIVGITTTSSISVTFTPVW